MQDDVKQTYLSTTLLAGLFSGLGGLLTSIVFNYTYRYFSGFQPAEIFNIMFMTLGVLLVSILLSIAYYNLPQSTRGNIYFRLIVIIIAVMMIIGGMLTNRGHNAITAAHFKVLLTGVVIITSCFNAIGIPYLSHHKNRFF